MIETKVHPTAIVDPSAKIGARAEIGPFSIVGSQVTIGDKTIVQSHVVIEGEVTIGSGNLIGHGAIIGTPPQDVSFSPQRKTKVEIGDDNIIREYCTIHRGTAEDSATKIGDKNFLMAGAHIGHNCEVGNNVIIANNCLLAGYVLVDDGAFLGGGSTFHQFMHIGRLVMVQEAPRSERICRRSSSQLNAILSLDSTWSDCAVPALVQRIEKTSKRHSSLFI